MGDKERANLRSVLSQIEQPHSRLPLVEDSDGALLTTPSSDALHQASGSDGKEATLVIVSIALVALQSISLPQLEVEGILLLPQRLEVHEEDGWLTCYSPVPRTHP